MKQLTKLRLINWHYFLNSKIDFGMINFLTGENAAGKSTLIDAMQVLLLGDTTGRSFNKAANEKSGRTLKSYLRGEIGDNDDGSTKYLRTGRFTSYIAMEFFDDVENWKQYVVVGAFCRESNELCGYALLSRETNNYVDFKVLKTNPEHEKKSVNAALVEGVMRYFDDFLKGGGYICDGARSINHETAFQDYLEKYFDFRKAYCRLHIKYRLKLKWLIKLTFPFRTLLLKFDRIRTVHLINSILRMEELCRSKNGG